MKLIYLGKLPDMDPREILPGGERAATTLAGDSYGSADNPLYASQFTVTGDDANGDGLIAANDALIPGRSEPISHSVSGQEEAYQIDSAFAVSNVDVTFLNPDGTTETRTLMVRVMQDTAGNTFLMPPPADAPADEIAALTGRPIVSVRFPTDPCSYGSYPGLVALDRAEFPDHVPCFVRGTLIRTDRGEVRVEDLAPGMLVMTRDRGLRPLAWVGRRLIDAATLAARAHLRPIRIRAGALGQGLPRRDLLVSPQHRILVRSRIALRMFGAAEILVAAKQLLQIEGIDIATDLPEVEYVHFLFDRHEIVLAEGAETESLHTGPEALKSVGPAARAEIFAIFPELREGADSAERAGARPMVSGRMGRKLAVRHARKGRELLQTV